MLTRTLDTSIPIIISKTKINRRQSMCQCHVTHPSTQVKCQDTPSIRNGHTIDRWKTSKHLRKWAMDIKKKLTKLKE